MKRSVDALANETWDVIVIGGGIVGSWIALDATLRGLRVALIEKADFASGASANSLKIVHGGFRYLRQGKPGRLRRSARELSVHLRVAPHLVRPLPVLVSASEFGCQRALLPLGLVAQRLLTTGVAREADAGVPLYGGLLPTDRCDAIVPEVGGRYARGGLLWYDAQVLDTERLLMAVLHSAAEHGAELANRVEATGFLRRDDHVRGVVVQDRLGGSQYELTARVVVNAAGEGAFQLLAGIPELAADLEQPFRTLAWNLGLRRRPDCVALGFRTRIATHSDPVLGAGRFMFCVPWERGTLLGTAYKLIGSGVPPIPSPDDLEVLLREFQHAAPELELRWEDVRFSHSGLLPLKKGLERGRATAPAERDHVLDHRSGGISDLLTVVAAKYTTARVTAERTVDRAFDLLDRPAPDCTTDRTPVWGAEWPIPSVEEASRLAAALVDEPVDPADAERLRRSYGSRLPQVLGTARTQGSADPPIEGSGLLGVEVRHAIRHEMAWTLEDVVLRRTGLGSAGCPPASRLGMASAVLARELNWNLPRLRSEVEACLRVYTPFDAPTTEEVLAAMPGAGTQQARRD